jgi:hypothetical protein
MLLLGDIATVFGEIEGRIRFIGLSVAVGKLADEVGFIPPFGPWLT